MTTATKHGWPKTFACASMFVGHLLLGVVGSVDISPSCTSISLSSERRVPLSHYVNLGHGPADRVGVLDGKRTTRMYVRDKWCRMRYTFVRYNSEFSCRNDTFYHHALIKVPRSGVLRRELTRCLSIHAAAISTGAA